MDQLPIACSLSAGELEERVREFKTLFAASLREVRRDSRRLELEVDARVADEAYVRDLLRREHACCPFFEFDVTASGGRIRIGIGVPEGAEPLLDGFEALANSNVC